MRLKEEAMCIEDTKGFVSDFQMLNAVLHLVMRKREQHSFQKKEMMILASVVSKKETRKRRKKRLSHKIFNNELSTF
jgi:hypothetical protein